MPATCSNDDDDDDFEPVEPTIHQPDRTHSTVTKPDVGPATVQNNQTNDGRSKVAAWFRNVDKLV